MTGLRICLTAGVGFLALALAGTGRLCAQVADAAPAEGATERRTSLNGTWKFSGLAAAPRPFGSLTDKERERLSPMTDDADWQTIPVPRDWWTLPKYETYRSGPFDTNRVYFCGFYRKAFAVATPRDGRRRFLRFEEIGAEAELFVNGRFVAHHLGDFVPFEAEVTDFLVAGTNLVALRVRADYAPLVPPPNKPPYTRPYGAHWDRYAIKGGLWHDVTLIETPSVRLTEVRVDPANDLSSVRIRLVVDNAGGRLDGTLTATWAADTAANAARPVATCRESVCASGRTDLTLDLAAGGRKPWSLEAPNLHSLVLVLTDAAGRVRATQRVRLGLRTMRVRNGRFELNGAPVYLVGDSLHSHKYGGRGRDNLADIRRDLAAWKANDVNLLRTAHAPAIPEVYDMADELGLMIYDEWCMSFCNTLDEAAFERNNLPALAAFVRRDYNHASVVCWSLGNEVKHQSPEVGRQLDLQYDLVKRLDGQNRPACAFSGVADVWLYGAARRKTDFLDTHRYHGIDSRSWTEWFPAMNAFYAQMAATYGRDGRLDLPLFLGECVGAGWGIRSDDGMRPGAVARYVDWSRRPCSWGKSEGMPFAGATGLLPILDSARGRHYLQGYLATRLVDLFRQDRRLAGFAPWFADPTVPGWMRWTQPTYPLLRNDATDSGRLMFRQLFAGETRRIDCVLVNDTAQTLVGLRAHVSFADGSREVPLTSVDVGVAGPFAEAVRPLDLTLPPDVAGDGEIRLRVVDAAGRDSRNAYSVRVHRRAEATAPVADAAAHEMVLYAADATLEAVCRRLGLRARVWPDGAELPESGTLVVPPGAAVRSDRELAAFVRRGGTLLALEPDGLTPPGFPFLRLRAAPNHLVEPVSVAHPVFDGLTASDFDTWAERPNGHVVERVLAPIDAGVLAARPRYIKDAAGMALAEYRFGAGRYVVSTVAAHGLWGVNPAATRYLRNLLASVVGGQHDGAAAPMLDPPDFRPTPTALSDDPLVVQRADAPPRRIDFPAAVTNAPFKILFFGKDKAKLATNRYRYLTLTFASRSKGLVDITIPERGHRNRLTTTLPLACSDGAPVTVRLDLEKDFRFARPGTFSLSEARGEIILYNGYEKDQGSPRPPASFTLHEVKFE